MYTLDVCDTSSMCSPRSMRMRLSTLVRTEQEHEQPAALIKELSSHAGRGLENR